MVASVSAATGCFLAVSPLFFAATIALGAEGDADADALTPVFLAATLALDAEGDTVAGRLPTLVVCFLLLPPALRELAAEDAPATEEPPRPPLGPIAARCAPQRHTKLHRIKLGKTEATGGRQYHTTTSSDHKTKANTIMTTTMTTATTTHTPIIRSTSKLDNKHRHRVGRRFLSMHHQQSSSSSSSSSGSLTT
jgi:hypothetical protein